ncbi:MAG: hypothetical protein ACTSRO_05875 [Candidatus Heimdallarchaeaceae archaeon]
MSKSTQQEPKRIVITGGSSGIGEAVALEMAKDGNRFFLAMFILV